MIHFKLLSSSAKTKSDTTLSNDPSNPQATQLLSEPKPETITTASSSSNQQAAASSTNTEPATTLPNGPSETETQLRIGLNVIQCFPIVKAFENDFKAIKKAYQNIERLDTHLTSELQSLTGITIATPPDRNRAIQSLNNEKRRPFIQLETQLITMVREFQEKLTRITQKVAPVFQANQPNQTPPLAVLKQLILESTLNLDHFYDDNSQLRMSEYQQLANLQKKINTQVSDLQHQQIYLQQHLVALIRRQPLPQSPALSEENINQWINTHQEFLGYVQGQLTHIQQAKAAISQHFQGLSEEDKEKRQLEFQGYIHPPTKQALIEALQALQEGQLNQAISPMIHLWEKGLDFSDAFSQVLQQTENELDTANNQLQEEKTNPETSQKNRKERPYTNTDYLIDAGIISVALGTTLGIGWLLFGGKNNRTTTE